MEKAYNLYELYELSGIDPEDAAGMIEDNKLPARTIDGEYKITKSDLRSWFDSFIDNMD